ncbi:MAG: outer membrane lipoprotein carrier protein LolA [Polyangiaceae bacterium]|nr:outer membrane lipoprotein carrier protein LolA [Polyangiaceae bacterium]
MKQKWLLIALVPVVALGVLPGSSALGQTPPPTKPSATRPPPALPEPSASEIADRVQAFYDRTTVFKSDFQQRYWVKAYDKTKDSRGQVIFKKPGKMSWRYTNNGNRVVSDGTVVKVYERDNKQMYEQRLNDSQYPAALSFLTGGAKLKQEFMLRKLNARDLKFEGGYVLEGAPKQPTAAYQKLLLFIDARTAQVRRVLLLDAQGNRNRFEFDNPVVNARVPDSEFSFEPPPGTQVIKP